MGVNSLPKTAAGQRRGCDLNPGPSAPESSTLNDTIHANHSATEPPTVRVRYFAAVLVYITAEVDAIE